MAIIVWLITIVVVIYTVVSYSRSLGSEGKNVKPRSVIITIIITLIVYAYIGINVVTLYYYGSASPMIILLLYMASSTVLGLVFVREDIQALSASEANFIRKNPFAKLGAVVHEFEYFFHTENPEIIDIIFKRLMKALKKEMNFSEARLIKITDIDKRLNSSDSREFFVAESTPSIRGGKVVEVIKRERLGNMYGIGLRFLIHGIIERTSVIRFALLSPLTLPFWIVGRLRRRHNTAVGLRDLYDADYEAFDLLAVLRGAYKLSLNELIDVLESHDIDVSDLRTMQAQTMNITITGGNASFGNIVQGFRGMIGGVKASGGAAK